VDKRLAMIIMLTGFAQAAGGSVTESTRQRWLDRVARLESCGNDFATGRAGERTRYQIKRAAWQHYSGMPFEKSARHPAEARRVARRILIDCERVCVRERRPVTFANVRRFYRRGGFRRYVAAP
jgi:hypothetical protein